MTWDVIEILDNLTDEVKVSGWLCSRYEVKFEGLDNTFFLEVTLSYIFQSAALQRWGVECM